MRKSIAVVGLGRFGTCVVTELSKNKNIDILAIDIVEENVQAVADLVENCVICDSTKKRDLQHTGISSVDHVIVAIGNNLEASILTVINIKALGVRKVTVRADDLDHREVFATLGATDVIIPEESSAKSLANRILSPGIKDYYNLSDAGDFSIVTIEVNNPSFPNKTLEDLKIRQTYHINLLCINRHDTVFAATPKDVIQYKDRIVVFGNNKQVKKFNAFVNEKVDELDNEL